MRVDMDDFEEALERASASLMRRHPGKAADLFLAALVSWHPGRDDLLEAYKAIQEGRNSDAVCALERVLHPSEPHEEEIELGDELDD